MATKYSVPQWHQMNKAKMFHANRARMGAENIIDETNRAIEETNKHTRNGQREVNTRLNQRINKVEHWTSEIDEKLTDLNNEIDALLDYKARVENAIAATIEPIAINVKCTELREQRTDSDVVYDKVEKDLAKEIETTQACQQLLVSTKEKIDEQIRKNRSARYYLEKDHKDKVSAQNLDNSAAALHNNTTTLSHRPHTVRVIARGSSHPQQWQNFTEVNIAKAEKERDNSKNLRSATDGVLRQTTEDMMNANKLTTFQFKERITETKHAKNKLEEHLTKVMGQIGDLEKSMRELEIAIQDKDAPLMVAESRMGIRQQRPRIELCRDPALHRLNQEVNEIENNIERLRALHYQSEKQLKDLLRQQLTLQEEIKVKENTLFIDEVNCLADRESIKLQFF